MSNYFRTQYGCRLHMSETDYHYACNIPPQFPWKPIDYPMDGYLTDMGTPTFGRTTIITVHTPGHTDGCMSFILPVTDEGRPHTHGLMGRHGCHARDRP